MKIQRVPLLEEPDHVFVALDGDTTVAVMHVNFQSGPQPLVLELVYVIPAMRRNGIARQLITHAEQQFGARLHHDGVLSGPGRHLVSATRLPAASFAVSDSDLTDATAEENGLRLLNMIISEHIDNSATSSILKAGPA